MEAQTLMNKYKIDKTIGKGTFGKVKLGIHLLTNCKVAIKLLEKEKMKDSSDIERVAREIHILKLARHPNIIQLYEIIETQKTLYLITEYASNGELFEHIVKNSRLEERDACLLFQQIISGVEYLHKMGVSHRDLKPENLLLDCKNNIKVVDFGLSNTYNHKELLQTACGSPCYAAPEMIAGKNYDGFKVDIWSCGVILFAMLAGFLPFEDKNTNELYRKILGCEYEFPEWISPAARDLIFRILNLNPEKRLSIVEIRNHPWFRQVFTLNSLGILVGFTQIPVNMEIVRLLSVYGIDQNLCKSSIEANNHDNVTTAYYLTLKQFEQNDPGKNMKIEFPIPNEVRASPTSKVHKFGHRKFKESNIKDLISEKIKKNSNIVQDICKYDTFETIETPKTLKNIDLNPKTLKLSPKLNRAHPKKLILHPHKSVTPNKKLTNLPPYPRLRSTSKPRSKSVARSLSPKCKLLNYLDKSLKLFQTRLRPG